MQQGGEGQPARRHLGEGLLRVRGVDDVAVVPLGHRRSPPTAEPIVLSTRMPAPIRARHSSSRHARDAAASDGMIDAGWASPCAIDDRTHRVGVRWIASRREAGARFVARPGRGRPVRGRGATTGVCLRRGGPCPGGTGRSGRRVARRCRGAALGARRPGCRRAARRAAGRARHRRAGRCRRSTHRRVRATTTPPPARSVRNAPRRAAPRRHRGRRRAAHRRCHGRGADRR